MKKILLAIDAEHMDTEVIHFACNIATLTHSTLTGYFINNYYEDAPVVNMAFGMPYVENVVAADPAIIAEWQQKLKEHIAQFEKTCAVKGVRCQVQCSNTTDPARTTIEESRFADMMIVQATTSFERKLLEVPTHFVKEVLSEAECPVLVAPLNLAGIEQIVFAYDGSRSAVFAIKQFAYMFPELADKKVIVLQVNKEETIPVTEKEKLGRLLRMHYSSIGFQVLQGKPSDELFGYLLGKENTIVVMGAYGRGWLSGLFKPATAGLLLKTLNLPFFITHQ
jgi:nucleotide-binding universal stress UspA family protein